MRREYGINHQPHRHNAEASFGLLLLFVPHMLRYFSNKILHYLLLVRCCLAALGRLCNGVRWRYP
jgi:hypothetical protein